MPRLAAAKKQQYMAFLLLALAGMDRGLFNAAARHIIGDKRSLRLMLSA
jgi:hypothetical protein